MRGGNVPPPPPASEPEVAPVVGGKRRKKRGARKVNAFFKIMLDAKKHGKPSFKYKGKTYKGRKHARLGMIYKKA